MKRNLKRHVKYIALMLSAVLLLASFYGCGEQSPSANGSGKKIVRINTSAEPDSLDPWLSSASDTEAIFHNVFEGLCLYNEKGDLVPGLAESWEISADSTVYTFHLRQNVSFHNGQKLTSADVLYSYNSLTGLGGGEPLTGKFDMIEKLEAPDDYTFVVTLSQPSASFLYLTTVAVLPQGYTQQSVSPVGTGPFKFVEYTPSQRIVLEKNESYYGGASGDEPSRMAKIDRVEIYIMTDTAAVVSALQSGQLDMAAMLNGDDTAALEGEFDIYHSEQNMAVGLFMNNEKSPFNDARVRQAVCTAINRDDIISGAFDGYATKIYSNFSPIMETYYNSDLEGAYPFDTEEAKRLLAAAGFDNGFAATLTVPANYQQLVDSAQIIAQQLAAVNINVNIETVEWASWIDRVYSKADYEMTIVGLSGKLDPDSILGRFETGYGKNFYNFSNAEYDSLIEAARIEQDNTARVDEYKRCQEILTEEAAAAFLADPHLFVACRKDLKGFTFYPVTFYDFSRLYFE